MSTWGCTPFITSFKEFLHKFRLDTESLWQNTGCFTQSHKRISRSSIINNFDTLKLAVYEKYPIIAHPCRFHFAALITSHTLNPNPTLCWAQNYHLLLPYTSNLPYQKRCLSNLILLLPTELYSTALQSQTTNKSSTENKIKPSAQHSYTSEQLKEIWKHTRPINLTSLPFGTIRTIWQLRLNNRTRKNRNRESRKVAWCGIDTWNLSQIATTDENNDEIVKNIRLSTVNAGSIKPKKT